MNFTMGFGLSIYSPYPNWHPDCAVDLVDRGFARVYSKPENLNMKNVQTYGSPSKELEGHVTISNLTKKLTNFLFADDVTVSYQQPR